MSWTGPEWQHRHSVPKRTKPTVPSKKIEVFRSTRDSPNALLWLICDLSLFSWRGLLGMQHLMLTMLISTLYNSSHHLQDTNSRGQHFDSHCDCYTCATHKGKVPLFLPASITTFDRLGSLIPCFWLITTLLVTSVYLIDTAIIAISFTVIKLWPGIQ